MNYNVTLDLATLVMARKEILTVASRLNPIEQAHFNNGLQLAVNVLTDMISGKVLSSEEQPENNNTADNNIKENNNNANK